MAVAAASNPYLPWEAEVTERKDESRDIFTLRLRLTDAGRHEAFDFQPGQFNMVYLYGVGEVPISIVSDPEEGGTLDHTIRALGRVTKGLAQLRAGDRVGIRGPFGRGWPLDRGEGRDVLLVTGGLGCAPLVSVINYIVKRRERYEAWAELPRTRVLLAADRATSGWRWHVGLVTDLLQDVDLDADDSLVMMCGPEAMMSAAAHALIARGFPASELFLSMERNMHCAVRHCGHCQFGPDFVCRDGPIFAYPRVAPLLQVGGF